MATADTAIERYYRFHSKIYDLTRWTFLFGRNEIVDLAAQANPAPRQILEIGCGTGKNLSLLCKAFPYAQITAVDMSEAMLALAEAKVIPHLDRITFKRQMYSAPINPNSFDLVLFSYSLTMMNPGWDKVLDDADIDLAPNGRIAVADFHDSPSPRFKKWMGVNHVRMDSHLQPKLAKLFTIELSEVKNAYAGWWQYLLFVGQKKA